MLKNHFIPPSIGFALLLLVGGCASATSGTQTPSSGPESSGGESPAPETQVVMRSTTPIAVPQPAVAREALSEPLQRIWEDVEHAVALTAPAPPQESSSEAIEIWAEQTLVPWNMEKTSAIRRAESGAEGLAQWSPEEQGIGAGLLGYLYEDMASGLRGTPVPAEIASDNELLGLYVEAIQELLAPYALASAQAYALCAKSLLPLGDDSGWAEWAQYCVDRAQDVATVYELKASADDGSPAGGSPAGGSASESQ